MGKKKDMTHNIQIKKFYKILKLLIGDFEIKNSIEGWATLYDNLPPKIRKVIRNTSGRYEINIVLLDDSNNKVATIGAK